MTSPPITSLSPTRTDWWPGVWPGGQQQLDRAVAEQVVVAVDELDLLADGGVVGRQEEVPRDRGRVVGRLPFAALDHDRNRRRQQRQPAGVVEVQVRDHDLGDRGPGRPARRRSPPARARTCRARRRCRSGAAASSAAAGCRPVSTRIRSSAVSITIRRDRDSGPCGSRSSSLAPDPGGGGEPPSVEHLDLHRPRLSGRLAAELDSVLAVAARLEADHRPQRPWSRSPVPAARRPRSRAAPRPAKRTPMISRWRLIVFTWR